jgi:hypothetical protein
MIELYHKGVITLVNLRNVTLRDEKDGDEETVVEWSLRHYELRHMGYKEILQ